jgi:hypothetical protein
MIAPSSLPSLAMALRVAVAVMIAVPVAAAGAPAAQDDGGSPLRVELVVPGSEPGPLERAATAVGPQQPMPVCPVTVQPIFPEQMRGFGFTVAVLVRATLDATGRVAEARALRLDTSYSVGVYSFGYAAPMAIDAALAALRQWRCGPPASAPLSFAQWVDFSADGHVRVYDPPRSTPVP